MTPLRQVSSVALMSDIEGDSNQCSDVESVVPLRRAESMTGTVESLGVCFFVSCAGAPHQFLARRALLSSLLGKRARVSSLAGK